MITLSSLDIFDLAFRFATVGQLSFLVILLYLRPRERKRLPSIALLVCVAAYLLLTTPIENEHYGWLRQPLLLLTDLTPFSILWLTQAHLRPQLNFKEYPLWVLISSLAWTGLLTVFFLFTDGRGELHDFNHLLGILVLIVVIFRCAHGYFDDLVNERRNARLLIILGCGVYMAMLTLFELRFQVIRDSQWFSLINASIIFMLVTAVSVRMAKANFRKQVLPNSKVTQESNPKSISPQAKSLNQLMLDGFHREQDLTVGKLAEALQMPEHQLRQLINQELGFTNFSHFLNSFRIPAVCRQLSDPSKRQIPILTLALDAGYGSIASFNRAFKQQIGLTPSQYRDQFQK